MDDTLYEEKEYVLSGYKAVDKWVKDKYKITGFLEVASKLFNLGERKRIFNKTLELLNVDYDENTICSMLDVYRSHTPEIRLLTDADWVIKSLIDSVKLGLISDGYLVSQKKKVEALKLDQRFHSIILSDQFGREHWKPSRTPYEKACSELNCEHNECVYVGDNLHKDFITAKKLGWSTVHINRPNGIYSNANVTEEYKADFKIRNLTELSELPILQLLFNRYANRGEFTNEY